MKKKVSSYLVLFMLLCLTAQSYLPLAYTLLKTKDKSAIEYISKSLKDAEEDDDGEESKEGKTFADSFENDFIHSAFLLNWIDNSIDILYREHSHSLLEVYSSILTPPPKN